MLKSFKTEINPTPEQKIRIHKTIGTCRYVYNFYLGHNKALHDNGEKFMTGKDFSLWLNNEYIPDNPDKTWIREVYSKAVKKSIEDGCTAFTRFFKHQSDFPKFKKKGKSDVKMYFVRNNPKDCQCERHRLKIPTLGWVRIKEKGYIPTTKDGYMIRSGTVSVKAGRFYVSVLVEIPDINIDNNSNEGIGIDLGLKDFAIVSNGKTYRNINKSAGLKKLEKQLIREQRSLSRKYESLKKGESTQRANIQKQKLKVQKLHHKMDNIRTDYINKTIAEIVKTKPSYITIEDLNVKGRHQGFAVGEHEKGQRVDVAGIAHGVKLTGVGKDDGQLADTLEQVEHAQRICGTAFGSLHKKVLLCAAPRPGMAELPDFWRIMLKIRDIYNKYNAFCPCCQSNPGRKHGRRIPGKVYHTHGLPATKGRIYIRVHRLTVSLSCIFVQLNLAFEPSMRYTLG